MYTQTSTTNLEIKKGEFGTFAVINESENSYCIAKEFREDMSETIRKINNILKPFTPDTIHHIVCTFVFNEDEEKQNVFYKLVD